MSGTGGGGEQRPWPSQGVQLLHALLWGSVMGRAMGEGWDWDFGGGFKVPPTLWEAVSRAWYPRVPVCWARRRYTRGLARCLPKGEKGRRVPECLTPVRRQWHKRLQSGIESAGTGGWPQALTSKTLRSSAPAPPSRPPLPPRALPLPSRAFPLPTQPPENFSALQRLSEVPVAASARTSQSRKEFQRTFISPFFNQLCTNTMRQTTGPQGRHGPLQYDSDGQDRSHPKLTLPLHTLPLCLDPEAVNGLNNKQPGWLAVWILTDLIAFKPYTVNKHYG